MANLTPADVYSPQVPGLATVLPSGLTPLRIYMQEAHRQQRIHDAAAKVKRQQEAEVTRNLLSMDASGASPYQDELLKTQQGAYNKQLEWYKQVSNGEMSMLEAKTRSLQEKSRVQSVADRTKEIDKQRAATVALATDPRYNKAALAQELGKVLYRTDVDGNLALIPSHEVDTNDFPKVAANPAVYNTTELVHKFLEDLGTKEQKDYTEAARAGVAGRARSGASNIFAYDEKANPLYTFDGQGRRVRQIANIGLLEEAAMRDPFMAGLLRKQLQEGQQPSAARLMGLPVGAVSDADLEALNAQTNSRTPHSRQVLADLVREYGTVAERNRELSPLAMHQPRASAVHQLKPGQATVAPTSDFGLSVGDTGAPVVETVNNPKKGGLLNFLMPKVQRTTTQVQAFDNHYPHVGVSFSTEKTPYVPLTVDSNELTTLGADGTPSHYNANKTNSQVRMNATDRSFVLEVNGKRLGLPKGGTSADAYQEMRRMIDDMTPEQARKAVLKAVYQGSVVDKSGVSGDGTGGKAKLLGYKGDSGRLLTEAEAVASKRAGEVLTPIYDTKERHIKVMHPATAQLDAQLARQAPGYNPRQRTAQEADLIQRLEAKGGNVVDPYHTTKPQSSPSTTRPSFIPTKTPSRGETRLENGVRVIGSKSIGIDWGRGGRVYKAPQNKTGGMFGDPPAKMSTGGLY